MTSAEKREAARLFCQKWNGRGKEDEDDRSYWIDIFQDVLGQDHVTDRMQFQKKVIGPDGNTKRIDVYIPETKVLVEQKSLGIDLDKAQAGHDGMTPYEQAKMYDNSLPLSEKAKWIIVSNFSEIRIYDMDTRKPEDNVTIINLADLQDKFSLLDFLVKEQVQKINEEQELSIKAGELVGKIHDRFQDQYNDPMAVRTQHSLNILCVRLVFCLYAEDAGLFGDPDAFRKYIEQYDPKDIRRALLDLFKVLNTPEDERGELYLDEELEAFPYCNGGLFARENIEIPKINEDIKQTLIDASHFDWSKISPTIFGAVFESTLNPETRRAGGMHYTSIENIHKVIDPLFLDELKSELDDILAIGVAKTRETKLRAYQDKLASLKFLDPAAGSGNFLTETYVSIRQLENIVIRELQHDQIVIGAAINPIKVSIDQFYGIEINDFAVEVAKAALWIAESQMMEKTKDIVHMDLDFLPLKTNATIIEGNALQLDWNRIVDKRELSYIMGNPPFVGHKNVSPAQKQDMINIFSGKQGRLDYVSAWYLLAAKLIQGTNIECAFVSTNTIVQGVHIEYLWNRLQNDYGIVINFAYKTFKWASEARQNASVFCVIIGFSKNEKDEKLLFDSFGENDSKPSIVKKISPYLDDDDGTIVTSRSTPLCDVSKMIYGNIPRDGGFYTFTTEEKEEFEKHEPASTKFFYEFLGSKEYINNKKRWILFLRDATPQELKRMPSVVDRIEKVRDFRLSSKAKEIHKFAETPTLFAQQTQPIGKDFIIVPIVSSSRRRYIPIGYVDGNVLVNNRVFIVPEADLYTFGILTSNVHNAWMRKVAVRLKDDYSYSKDLVYNNFPWPIPTNEQREHIEKAAQSILDARKLYPNDSLADLYDPITMPIELKRAHQTNDRAVMEAYGFNIKTMSEAECVAELMKMYQELTSK